MTQRMLRQLERVQFGRGTKIFREGEPGSFAYLVEKGKVEISAVNHGQKIVISTLGEGELFGEMALIDNLKRSATATAIEDTDVITLDRAQFDNKIGTADPVLHLLLRVVLKRFRWALRKALDNDRMNLTGQFSVSGQTAIFDETRDEAIRQIRLEQDLQIGLSKEQFELHYQPILATCDQRIVGFEALIRWRHPDRGMVSPAEFIPAAEDSNLIIPIGQWVLEQACADLARLQAAQPPNDTPLFMAINVSARQIQDLAKKEPLIKAMRLAGIKPEHVKLEFTEGVLMDSPELANQALAEIKQTGVTFAIDDFGTGYSSLSYLHRFPLDVLKIDRSFISQMVDDHHSRQIVRSIIGLSKGLSMDVVAEGIETRESLEMLTTMGCDFLQGFLASRAVPIEEALAMVASGVNLLADTSLTQAKLEPA